MTFALRSLLVAAVLLIALPAVAIPVNYNLDIGDMVVQARRSDNNELVFSERLDLGAGSFMQWDSAAIAPGGGGSLTDFALVLAPGQGAFSTLLPYGPFSEVTVETGAITAGGAYSTNFSFPSGPNTFVTNGGTIDIDATYSACNAAGDVCTPGAVPATIVPTPNNMDARVTLGALGAITVVMDSVVMGNLSGAPFQETADLIITANIDFFGSQGDPIPEPGTGLLVGYGLVVLGAWRRRQS
jgi:hypothetical protein